MQAFFLIICKVHYQPKPDKPEIAKFKNHPARREQANSKNETRTGSFGCTFSIKV